MGVLAEWDAAASGSIQSPLRDLGFL